ncbi:MAG: hypothetical protein SFU99_13975 [Saprospiraceae bacterium]|nr:hypothetical protein [Saprospiraceae bacterium]
MKVVALTLAVYMLLGSLFPQADFSQLPKMIYAFKHFQQHCREEANAGKTTSLWEFVELHFFQPDEHGQGHQQEHSQLPLHSIGNALTAVATQYPVLPKLTFVENIFSIFHTNQSIHLPGFKAGIFRPPVQS